MARRFFYASRHTSQRLSRAQRWQFSDNLFRRWDTPGDMVPIVDPTYGTASGTWGGWAATVTVPSVVTSWGGWTATAIGQATTPVVQRGARGWGGWETLVRLAVEDERRTQARGRVACPQCGTPLSRNGDGILGCTFDGYISDALDTFLLPL